MRVRALDVNGDWLFGKGANDYLKDLDALAQSIKTRLKSFLNDCFFDKQSGIDWFNLLGAKNQLALDLAVSATILNTDGVASLTQLSINLDRSTRRLTIKYTVMSTLGRPITSELLEADLLTTEDNDIITTEGDDPIEVF